MKRFCNVLLSATLLLGLAACAPKTNDRNNNVPSQSTQQPQQTQTPTYEPLTLYFLSENRNHLVKETQETALTEGISKEEQVLLTLKKGAKGENLSSPLSDKVEILSVKTVSGLCTVDLSSEFSKQATGTDKQDELCIQSIVHSICQLDTVTQVKINISGDTKATFGNHISLSQPITPNVELLKSA